MRLYVEPMDATVVEVNDEGKVRLATDEWITPTLQERRAIIYAAEHELESLRELLEAFAKG